MGSLRIGRVFGGGSQRSWGVLKDWGGPKRLTLYRAGGGCGELYKAQERMGGGG